MESSEPSPAGIQTKETNRQCVSHTVSERNDQLKAWLALSEAYLMRR